MKEDCLTRSTILRLMFSSLDYKRSYIIHTRREWDMVQVYTGAAKWYIETMLWTERLNCPQEVAPPIHRLCVDGPEEKLMGIRIDPLRTFITFEGVRYLIDSWENRPHLWRMFNFGLCSATNLTIENADCSVDVPIHILPDLRLIDKLAHSWNGKVIDYLIAPYAGMNDWGFTNLVAWVLKVPNNLRVVQPNEDGSVPMNILLKKLMDPTTNVVNLFEEEPTDDEERRHRVLQETIREVRGDKDKGAIVHSNNAGVARRAWPPSCT